MNTVDRSLFPTYGIAFFAVLMLLGWWRARRRDDPTAMAATVWAPLATVIAVAVNQPVAGWFLVRRPLAGGVERLRASRLRTLR